MPTDPQALLRASAAADEPIVAASTPSGRGAVAVVRVSGRPGDVERLCARVVPGDLPPRLAVLRSVLDASGALLDRALVLRFPAPRSYTGQEVVEVQLHGNPLLVAACVRSFMAAGARPAGPGEFTRRAVAHGRLDLVEAEAVDAVVRAGTLAAARAAQRHLGGELSARLGTWRDQLMVLAATLEALVDFPEDVGEGELRGPLQALDGLAAQMERLAATFEAGRRAAEGARVVLLGPVNAGKSTLFNALLGHERAIVSPQPGTTRDVVSEAVDWHGVALRLEDTAGRRPAQDPVERQGIERSLRAASAADLRLEVRDARGLTGPPPPGSLGVATHCDLAPCPRGWHRVALGEGVAGLRRVVAERLVTEQPEDLIVHSERQNLALCAAAEATRQASRHGAQEPVLCSVTVRQAGQALQELLGDWTSEEVLDALFSRFCVGK